MYNYSDIRQVHLEITDKCNAACPMCVRNIYGGADSPCLRYVEITLDDFKTIFPEDFLKKLYKLEMCGNFGDPMIARDTIKIFKYIKSINHDVMLTMHTNASGRNPQWWQDLGSVMQGISEVRFSIDGLEDTNHIYRRRTKWNKIMSAAENFIAAGGNAVWEYLIFKHNQHQVIRAELTASKMGFSRFVVKSTGRFQAVQANQILTGFPVQDINGNFEYYLEPTNDPKYQNKSIKTIRHNKKQEIPKEKWWTTIQDNNITREYGSMQNYFDTCKINCKVAGSLSVFIDAAGHVFPCCWVAFPALKPKKETPDQQLVDSIERIGGWDKINAKKHSLQSIVESDWFRKEFTDSWSLNSIKEGKKFQCAKTCGSKFDHVGDEYMK